MSDEYPDDFCEELQSPTAAAAAAAAASAARPSPSSALRQSSSIRPAGAVRQSYDLWARTLAAIGFRKE